jgi:KaiC/GvpD/RAD55 family RecA-like ATPase
MEAVTMQKFRKIQKGLSDFGKIVPIEDLEDNKKLKGYTKSAPKKDWYVSLFYFDEEAKKHFDKKNGSISGYQGKAFCDKLVFDLDSSDLSLVQKEAQELLQRLQNEGVDILNSTRIFFSGNKGFHIEVPISQSFEPKQLKTICTNIADGLTTFDPKIYNTTRIFRLRNTINPKSGLYKIELEPDDLINLTVDEIKTKAKTPCATDFKPKVVKDLSFLDKYKVEVKRTYGKPVIISEEEFEGIRGLDTIDFSKMPKYVPRCVYALEHGIMVPGIGERSEIFLRLAAYYRNQGYNKDKAHNALKAVARLNSELYPEADPMDKTEIYNTAIKSAYSENWKQVPGATGIDLENPIFQRYCDAVGKYTEKRCSLHSRVEKKETVMQIDDAFDSFSRFAENFEKNTVQTGIDFIDSYMKIAVGTTTLVAGAAGSGKTTLCLNIMENANKAGLHSMFFSMDMNKNLVSLKLAQKLTNYSQDQILKIFREKDVSKMQQIRKAMKDTYGLTYFDFSAALTLDAMREKIYDTEERTGNKIKLVVVDYAGRISSDKGNSYDNAKYNALKSVEVANDTEAAWLILTQISRNSGDGSSPIRTKRAAKDSSDWEESATNVITLWRPFMGGDATDNPNWTDDTMRVYLAKNRMGAELEQPLYWSGSKGIVRDMSPTELADYKANREPEEKEFLKAKYSRE